MTIDFTEEPVIEAGKRIGIQHPVWMGDDFFTSLSPRNDNNNAEGPWCHWVHLARLVLADERTREQMPEHFRPYGDPPRVWSDHHPDCTAAGEAS